MVLFLERVEILSSLFTQHDLMILFAVLNIVNISNTRSPGEHLKVGLVWA